MLILILRIDHEIAERRSGSLTTICLGSVGRVKWRPQRKDYLSSSSLVVDSAIHVWDIKRPFVPFASFDNHKVSWTKCFSDISILELSWRSGVLWSGRKIISEKLFYFIHSAMCIHSLCKPLSLFFISGLKIEIIFR